MMKTPKQILDYISREIGLDGIASALGVSVASVDRAARDSLLPASWLDVLERLARQPLDRAAFNFRGVK
jgi:hypothetical protein